MKILVSAKKPMFKLEANEYSFFNIVNAIVRVASRDVVYNMKDLELVKDLGAKGLLPSSNLFIKDKKGDHYSLILFTGDLIPSNRDPNPHAMVVEFPDNDFKPSEEVVVETVEEVKEFKVKKPTKGRKKKVA